MYLLQFIHANAAHYLSRYPLVTENGAEFDIFVHRSGNQGLLEFEAFPVVARQLSVTEHFTKVYASIVKMKRLHPGKTTW